MKKSPTQNNPLDSWLEAAKIFSLSWAKPFFIQLGLSEKGQILLQQSYQELLALKTANFNATIDQWLVELAQKTEPEILAEVPQWVEYHFIDHQIRATLNPWWSILYTIINNNYFGSLPKPTSWTKVDAQISQLFDKQKDNEFIQSLQQVSPPPTEEEQEVGLTINKYASVIQEIVNNQLALNALKTFYQELDKEEFQEVITWIETIAEETSI